MIGEFLDKTSLKLVDYLLDLPVDFTLENIRSSTGITRNTDLQALVDRFRSYGILGCKNETAPLNVRKYYIDETSPIMKALIGLDWEFSKMWLDLKRRRAHMPKTAMPETTYTADEVKDAVVAGT